MGRNLANMELLIIVASLFRRYHFVLEDPDKEVRVVSLSLSCVLGCLELTNTFISIIISLYLISISSRLNLNLNLTLSHLNLNLT